MLSKVSCAVVDRSPARLLAAYPLVLKVKGSGLAPLRSPPLTLSLYELGDKAASGRVGAYTSDGERKFLLHKVKKQSTIKVARKNISPVRYFVPNCTIKRTGCQVWHLIMSMFSSNPEPAPNKFTVRMGELIKLAREEAGLSQKQLADRIFRRRATVSDIENGKSEVGTLTLARIADTLDKPLISFYPEDTLQEQKYTELTPDDMELLFHFDKLYDENLQKSVIGLVKSLSNYSPVTGIEKLIEIAENRVERDRALLELRNKRKRK